MELIDVIRQRQSVRAYKPNPVEEDKLQRVLEAARLAPSACNFQPWHFYVVRDPAVREQLCRAYRADWFRSAPVIICACGNTKEAWKRADGKSYLDVDVAIAVDHLILAAENEGLATCWIGAFDPALTRQALNIPAALEPIAMTPLGYAASRGQRTGRKPLERIATFIG